MIYVIYLVIFNKNLPLNTVMTIDENEIDEHNNLRNNFFKRGGNSFFEGTTLSEAKSLINTSFSSHSNLAKCKNLHGSSPLPDNYNFHTQYPRCGAKVANQQSKVRN